MLELSLILMVDPVRCGTQGLACGCTACVVLVRGRSMHVAWLGDSQVMLCRAGKAVPLMEPHKPEVRLGPP